MGSPSVRVVATGAYLPATVVPSHELDARFGLPPGTVERRTGMRTRRWVDGETTSGMAAAAIAEALAGAGLAAEAIDLLVCASGVAERPIPSTASLVARHLGISGIACYDVNATCLSFLVALDVVTAKLRLGEASCAAIVSSDIASVGLDPREFESAALFGDGAAALVLRGEPAPAGSDATHPRVRLETYPEGVDFTTIAGGGSAFPPSRYTPESAAEFLFHMNGPAVYRLARKVLAPFAERFAAQVGSGWPALVARAARVVPHQASPASIPLLARHLGIPIEKVAVNVERVGNLVAASLPYTLHEERSSGRLRSGDDVLMIGTGAGLGVGAAWLRL
jgi:3-oxoacyl-[acyl-carrier-protein] synthase III